MNQRQLLFKALREYKDTLFQDIQLNRLSTKDLQDIHDYIIENEKQIKENIAINKKNLLSLIKRNKIKKQEIDLSHLIYRNEVIFDNFSVKLIEGNNEKNNLSANLVLQQGAVGGSVNSSLDTAMGFVRELLRVKIDTFLELKELELLRKRDKLGDFEVSGKGINNLNAVRGDVSNLRDNVLPEQVLEKYRLQTELVKQETKNFVTKLTLSIPESIREGFQNVINSTNKNIVGGNQLSNIQGFTKNFGDSINEVYEKLATINFLNGTGVTNQSTQAITNFLGNNLGNILKDSLKAFLVDLRVEIKGFFGGLKSSIDNLNNSIQNKLPRAFPDVIREVNLLRSDREKSKELTDLQIEKLSATKQVLGVDKLITELEGKVSSSVENPSPFDKVNNDVATVLNSVKAGIIDQQVAGLLLRDKTEESLSKISESASVLRFVSGVNDDSRDLSYGDNPRVAGVNRVIREGDRESTKYQGIIDVLRSKDIQDIVSGDVRLSSVVSDTITQLSGAIESLDYQRKKAISDFKSSFSQFDREYLDIYTGSLESNFQESREFITRQSDSFTANKRILELELGTKRQIGLVRGAMIDSEIADIIATPLPSDPTSAMVESQERQVKIAKLEFDKEQINKEVKDIEDRLKHFGDVFGDVFRQVGEGMTDSIKGFFDGVIEGRDNALDAIRDIPKMIQKIMVRSLVDRFIAPLFKPFSQPEQQKLELQRVGSIPLDFVGNQGVNLDSLVMKLSSEYSNQLDIITEKFGSSIDTLETNTVGLLKNIEKIDFNVPIDKLQKYYEDLVNKLAESVDLSTVNDSIVSIEGILRDVSAKLDKIIGTYGNQVVSGSNVGNGSNSGSNTNGNTNGNDNGLFDVFIRDVKDIIGGGDVRGKGKEDGIGKGRGKEDVRGKGDGESEFLTDEGIQEIFEQGQKERKIRDKEHEKNLVISGTWVALLAVIAAKLGFFKGYKTKKPKPKDTDKKDDDDDDDHDVGGGLREEDVDLWEDSTADEVLEDLKQEGRGDRAKLRENLRGGVPVRGLSDYEKQRREEDEQKRQEKTRKGLEEMGLWFSPVPALENTNNFFETTLQSLSNVISPLNATLGVLLSTLNNTNQLLVKFVDSGKATNVSPSNSISTSKVVSQTPPVTQKVTTNSSKNTSQVVAQTPAVTQNVSTNNSRNTSQIVPKNSQNTSQVVSNNTRTNTNTGSVKPKRDFVTNSLGQMIPQAVYNQLINAPDGSTTRLNDKIYIRTSNNVAETTFGSKYSPQGSTLQYTVTAGKNGLPVLMNAGLQFSPINPTANNPKSNQGTLSLPVISSQDNKVNPVNSVNPVGQVLGSTMKADDKFWLWLAKGISSNKNLSQAEAWLRQDNNAEKIRNAGLTVGFVMSLLQSGGLTGLVGGGASKLPAIFNILRKPFLGFNQGGMYSDSNKVNAVLTPNELVIPANQAKAISYNNLELLNNLGKGNIFSGGGVVKGNGTNDTVPATLRDGDYILNSKVSTHLANHLESKSLGGIFNAFDSKYMQTAYKDKSMFGIEGLSPLVGNVMTLGLQLWGIFNQNSEVNKANKLKRLQLDRILAATLLSESEKSEGAYLTDEYGQPSYHQTRNKGGIIQRLFEGGEVINNVTDIQRSILENQPTKPKGWLDYLPSIALTAFSFLMGGKEKKVDQEKKAENERIKILTSFGNDPFLANKRLTDTMRNIFNIKGKAFGWDNKKRKEFERLTKANLGGKIGNISESVRDLPRGDLFAKNLRKGNIFKGSGYLSGWGNSQDGDVIPAKLKAGDYVLNAKSTEILRNNKPSIFHKLKGLNRGGAFTKNLIESPLDFTPVSIQGNIKKFFSLKRFNDQYLTNTTKENKRLTDLNKFNLEAIKDKVKDSQRDYLPEKIKTIDLSNISIPLTQGLNEFGKMNMDSMATLKDGFNLSLPQSFNMDNLADYSIYNNHGTDLNEVTPLSSLSETIPESFARAFNDSNMTPQEIKVDYNVKKIDNVDYVSKSEFMAGINYASQAGANIVQNKLKYNPNYRKNLGF